MTLMRPVKPGEHTCRTQCDGCHTTWHCQEAAIRNGELLLCGECWLRMLNGETLAHIHQDWPHERPRS